MEKLQLALEKARKKREESGPAGTRAEVSPTAQAKPSPQAAPGFRATAESWQSLQQISLDSARLAKHRIVSHEASASAGEFDLLRTKVLLQMRKNGWKRLAITSPTPGCGKTTTAANLSLGFTRQPDKSVILFEMDMRRPSLASILGHRPDFGVGDLLNGGIEFSRQAVRAGDNVALSLNVTTTKNSAQLLMRDSTSRIIDAIEDEFQPDLMIFDLPPMLVSDDTTAFLKNVDCALLLAAAESTSVSQVDACEREIAEHTNVLGVVLNKCRFTEEESSYGYQAY